MRDARRGLLGIALLTAGCSDVPRIFPPIPPTGPFLTDSVRYVSRQVSSATFKFSVVARYSNPLNAPIHLRRCSADAPHPDYDVDLLSPGSNGYVVTHGCDANDSPIVVAPGATRTDTLTIVGPTSSGSGMALSGVFRLTYPATVCPTAGSCSPATDSLQHSNAFTVTLSLFGPDNAAPTAYFRDGRTLPDRRRGQP